MHTRNGICYPRTELAMAAPVAKRSCGGRTDVGPRKRGRASRAVGQCVDFFDGLPDDLVLLILSKLSASATSPSDLVSVLLTSRRFNFLATHPAVLARLSSKGMAIRAAKWSESAHRFLKRCADAGSLDACYFLGMICFYCLEKRGIGATLMAKAGIGSHAEALYSLAVIQFNGSGGTKSDKDLRAGVALCARAAFHGHVDALRELGHCLQDGYGVKQNVTEGRRFLVQANARELAGVFSASQKEATAATAAAASLMKLQAGNGMAGFSACSLLSDFGCNVPIPEVHPANRFMVDWFAAKGGPSGCGIGVGDGLDGLRMCSHGGCGRPETRRHEFRRCSVCGVVNYCSRACQALHWKVAHKLECAPMERWLDEDVGGDAAAGAGDGAPAARGGRAGNVN